MATSDTCTGKYRETLLWGKPLRERDQICIFFFFPVRVPSLWFHGVICLCKYSVEQYHNIYKIWITFKSKKINLQTCIRVIFDQEGQHSDSSVVCATGHKYHRTGRPWRNMNECFTHSWSIQQLSVCITNICRIDLQEINIVCSLQEILVGIIDSGPKWWQEQLTGRPASPSKEPLAENNGSYCQSNNVPIIWESDKKRFGINNPTFLWAWKINKPACKSSTSNI